MARLCRQRLFLHVTHSWFDERDSPCLSKLFIHGRKECIQLTQGGPEIKYLLQEGMSGKGSLLAKPSGPLGTSLAWRTLF